MGERRATDDTRDDGDRRGDPGSTVATGVGAASSADGPRGPRHRPRTARSAARSVDTGGSDVGRDAVAAALDRLTTVEPWTPDPPTDHETRSVRRRLRADESLKAVDGARLVGEAGGPAAVGLTDQRLLAVTDGGMVSVGLDGLAAVHSGTETALDVRGQDARLLGAVGYLCSVLAFLAVLGVAANPLTPALALATVGGVLAADHVRREGFAPNDRTLTDRLGRYAPFAALADGIRSVEHRLPVSTSDDPLARWGAGALAVGPFAVLLAFEGGVLAPLFALAIVGSFALVVRAVRHSEEFDGVELLRRPRRTISATFEDGTVVTLRTHPESPLERELAARVGGATARSRADD